MNSVKFKKKNNEFAPQNRGLPNNKWSGVTRMVMQICKIRKLKTVNFKDSLKASYTENKKVI